jgi:hypothetical protein
MRYVSVVFNALTDLAPQICSVKWYTTIDEAHYIVFLKAMPYATGLVKSGLSLADEFSGFDLVRSCAGVVLIECTLSVIEFRGLDFGSWPNADRQLGYFGADWTSALDESGHSNVPH